MKWSILAAEGRKGGLLSIFANGLCARVLPLAALRRHRRPSSEIETKGPIFGALSFLGEPE